MPGASVEKLFAILSEQGIIPPLPRKNEYSEEELLSYLIDTLEKNRDFGKTYRILQSLHELIPPMEGAGFHETAEKVRKKAAEIFPAQSSCFYLSEDEDDQKCRFPKLQGKIPCEIAEPSLHSKGYCSYRDKNGNAFLVFIFPEKGHYTDMLLLEGKGDCFDTPLSSRLASLFSFFASAALAKARSTDLISRSPKSIQMKEQLQEEHERTKKNENLILMSQFAVGLNHEINNPLAVIKGALFLMKKELQECHKESLIKNMKRIEEAASSISGIVLNLENLKRKYKITEYLKNVNMVDFSPEVSKEDGNDT
ncbi:MAG TPA: hypothetical protein ENN72_01060 [Firmicutes bacterium]|nr:hypothetical protein [Bacillota bacterium]